MTTHIGAKEGDIAKTVLLPGDPKRAEWIARRFLKNPFCYSDTRGMLGFTGTIIGTDKRVSVQGSGMGMPSLSIYVHELTVDFGVKRIIRVGSAGGLREDLPCRSIVLAIGSCSDSALNIRRFHGMSFAPVADWNLLSRASIAARELDVPVRVGNILATDKFYDDVGPETWKVFARAGVCAVEMETAELYTLAALEGFQALSILTISDNLVTGVKLSPEEREGTFEDMMRIAFWLV